MAEEMSIASFAEALGSSAATPGGGAASALVGALAAALAEMVAQLTVGRAKYQAVEGEAREVLERTRAIRAALLALVAEDAAAFQGVAAAYRLPRGSDAERAQREAAIQAALRQAMQPPLRVMALVCDALELAQTIATIGNATVASDAGCAAVLGEAAVRSGALNVLANVVLLRDAPAAEAAHQRSAELEQRAAHLSAATLAIVRERMGA